MALPFSLHFALFCDIMRDILMDKAMTKTVFEQIKKQNGEAFAKALRSYDNGIFDVPNIVQIVRYAGRNPMPILPYLESLKNIQIESKTVDENPLDLLAKAGYRAYVADTLQKQNAIEKYFSPSEKLCTFHDKNRFKDYYIINAVKENAETLNRDDFLSPKREDAYGTSVISIQILKSGGFISIKNRYNHTVKNPDNTFNSNPDNIIDGLSSALKAYFSVDFSSHATVLPDDYALVNGQIIHYHEEVKNVYFGKDFYAKNGVIYPIDKDKEIMLENVILNLKTHSLTSPWQKKSAFMQAFEIEIKDKKLQVLKSDDNTRSLYANGVFLACFSQGRLIALNLPSVQEIGNCFLQSATELKQFSAPQIRKIGYNFLYLNEKLSTLKLPRIKDISDCFLARNTHLKSFSAPVLKTVGYHFLASNNKIKTLALPKLEFAGFNFLGENKTIRTLNLPRLKATGTRFLHNNTYLKDCYKSFQPANGNCLICANSVVKDALLPAPKKKETYPIFHEAETLTSTFKSKEAQKIQAFEEVLRLAARLVQ